MSFRTRRDYKNEKAKGNHKRTADQRNVTFDVNKGDQIYSIYNSNGSSNSGINERGEFGGARPGAKRRRVDPSIYNEL